MESGLLLESDYKKRCKKDDPDAVLLHRYKS